MADKSQRPTFTGSSFWDERFGMDKYIYGTEPNVFFKTHLDVLPPGKILLPAEGEGRNAVYAARQGWEVHALDFSEQGLAKALQLAKQYGVSINYEIADVAQYNTDERFDVVAFLFMHQAADQRKAIFRRYLDFLKPGGRVIIEVFNKKQLGLPSGGPKNLDYLIDASELAEIFADLDLQLLEEVETELNEGDHHSGLGRTSRMIGVKR